MKYLSKHLKTNKIYDIIHRSITNIYTDEFSDFILKKITESYQFDQVQLLKLNTIKNTNKESMRKILNTIIKYSLQIEENLNRDKVIDELKQIYIVGVNHTIQDDVLSSYIDVLETIIKDVFEMINKYTDIILHQYQILDIYKLLQEKN
jgi:hypothetical protein